jgi:hypothetical protein
MAQVKACDRCFQGFAPDDTVNEMKLVVNGKEFNLELCDTCKQVILNSLVVRKRTKDK